MNPMEIRQQFAAFQRSRILLTAFELKLFTLLDRGPQTSETAAAVLQTDQRATDRLLNALCAIGFTEKKDGQFSNPEFVSKHLVKGKPGYISGLAHTADLWETWSDMTAVIRSGRPVIATTIDNRGEQWLEDFIEAMHNRAQFQVEPSLTPLDLANVESVLDVGGGSAAFAMGFVRARKGLKATVFDLPNVVPITRRYIEAEDMADDVDVRTGDYNTDELPVGYDLVFLSAIIHANDFAQNEALITKCANSLNPGGQLAVQDFIMDDDRIRPEHGAIFALNMLTGTENGDTYTESEIRGWMEAAGLKNVQRFDLPFGTGQIVGMKQGRGNLE